MKLKFIRFGKKLLPGFWLMLIGVGGYAGYLVAEHNFHVVLPGQVYRSSRMSPGALTRLMQARDIQSVLSLIGPSLVESNTVRAMGGTYFDVSLSDRHEATDAQMERIVTILRTAPKPVLIHCKAGADRAGLAASLYRYAIAGQPAAVADDELTIRYGHLPACLGFGTSAMDRSYWRYVTNAAAAQKPAAQTPAGGNRRDATGRS